MYGSYRRAVLIDIQLSQTYSSHRHAALIRYLAFIGIGHGALIGYTSHKYIALIGMQLSQGIHLISMQFSQACRSQRCAALTGAQLSQASNSHRRVDLTGVLQVSQVCSSHRRAAFTGV